MTLVVCVAEFLGRPVETNIVDTAKKGRENEIFKNVHNSHQYVAVGLNKKSGSLAMTEGQLISQGNFGVSKKVNPFL